MRKVNVLFYREDKYWVAQAIGVEVSSFGETLDEAKNAITEALELYYEV